MDSQRLYPGLQHHNYLTRAFSSSEHASEVAETLGTIQFLESDRDPDWFGCCDEEALLGMHHSKPAAVEIESPRVVCAAGGRGRGSS